ncbi:MAG: hypothetical protein H0X18_15810 [Geodermatophilaceae bacterium]|nr:hypothetical protein [Geodermatophilaceae bacterium]
MSQSLREMTRQHVEHIQDGAGQKKRRYDDADEVNLTGYAASLTAFALAAVDSSWPVGRRDSTCRSATSWPISRSAGWRPKSSPGCWARHQ